MATGGRGSLHWFGHLSRSQSKFLNALNPFNYISMGTVLNLAGFPGTSGTRHNKPMMLLCFANRCLWRVGEPVLVAGG